MSNTSVLPNEKVRRLTLGSARASRAVFGALAENFSIPRATFSEVLGEARALPGLQPR